MYTPPCQQPRMPPPCGQNCSFIASDKYYLAPISLRAVTDYCQMPLRGGCERKGKMVEPASTFGHVLICHNYVRVHSIETLFITSRKQSFGKVIFSQASVILPACITGHMTGGVVSRGWTDPPTASHPEIHGKLRDTVNKSSVRILLECILDVIFLGKLYLECRLECPL